MAGIKDQGIEALNGFALKTIHELGEKSLSYYGKGNPKVQFDERLITEAELNLTELFQQRLNQAFPQHQLFMNTPASDEYTHEEKRHLWIFDPLDGVANFQAGIPIWGISLALFENFWPVLGMVYMPATDDLFSAIAGRKAFRGEKEICISSHETINDESNMYIYSRFHHDYHSSFPGKIRNLGCTAAHLCCIAMGRADVAVIAHESYQGLAASQIIIEAAGAKIFKMDGTDFHLSDYLDGQKIVDRLMVCAPHICPEVIKCLKTGG